MIDGESVSVFQVVQDVCVLTGQVAFGAFL